MVGAMNMVSLHLSNTVKKSILLYDLHARTRAELGECSGHTAESGARSRLGDYNSVSTAESENAYPKYPVSEEDSRMHALSRRNIFENATASIFGACMLPHWPALVALTVQVRSAGIRNPKSRGDGLMEQTA